MDAQAERKYRLLFDENDDEYMRLFFTCTICVEKELDCFWSLHGCSEGRYCRECYSLFLVTWIKDKSFPIKCPTSKCGRILDEETEIIPYLNKEETELYYFKKLRFELLKDSNFIECPTRDCGYPFSKREQDTYANCPNCHKDICFNCKEEMHKKIDCKQYQKLKLEHDKNLRLTEEWKKNKTKSCPQCKSLIEKTIGCDHMTCSNCKYEFCWKCLEKYYDGHIREKHPIRPGNLIARPVVAQPARRNPIQATNIARQPLNQVTATQLIPRPMINQPNAKRLKTNPTMQPVV